MDDVATNVRKLPLMNSFFSFLKVKVIDFCAENTKFLMKLPFTAKHKQPKERQHNRKNTQYNNVIICGRTSAIA
jgi:hypothetical protein